MKKKQKSSLPNCPSVAKASKLNPIHPNAAGIDICSQNHWVCVPPGCANESVRRFGCYTADLYAIADWLAECRVEPEGEICVLRSYIRQRDNLIRSASVHIQRNGSTNCRKK